MKKIILIIGLIIFGYSVYSQGDSVYVFSVDEAVEFAFQNNLNIENADAEVQKAKWKVWETTAMGLPQVSGNAELQTFIDIPTQLMPNFMLPVVVGVNSEYYGLQPIKPLPQDEGKVPVQFGSKYNASWGVSLSQLIFSGEYIVGLQAAKTYKLLAEQNYDKAKLELKYGVLQAYYLVLIAEQSLQIVGKNYDNIKKIADDTQKMADAGMTDQIQADQVKILELNLKNQISNLQRQKELAYMMLKFQLGLDNTDSVHLSNTLDEVVESLNLQIVADDYNINSNMDWQLMQTQKTLKELDLKRAKAKTLPTLAGYVSYSEKAMQDDFNFFDENASWYPTSVWGVKLSVPIFGSGQKYAVIKQKQIDVLEMNNKTDLFRQQIDLQFQQAKNDYLNAFDNYLTQKKNLELSQRIYDNMQIKFKQGTAGSMDLTNAQNQYLQAESAYYQAILQVLNAKISLEKIKNE